MVCLRLRRVGLWDVSSAYYPFYCLACTPSACCMIALATSLVSSVNVLSVSGSYTAILRSACVCHLNKSPCSAHT